MIELQLIIVYCSNQSLPYIIDQNQIWNTIVLQDSLPAGTHFQNLLNYKRFTDIRGADITFIISLQVIYKSS